MNIKPYFDQHREALGLVQKLQEKMGNPAQNADDIAGMLLVLVGRLTFHLSMEDKFIYPKATSSSHPQLQAVAKKMQAEMAPIGEAISAYAKAWNSPAAIRAQPEVFVAETGKIVAALKNRIDAEEKTFYPLVANHLT